MFRKASEAGFPDSSGWTAASVITSLGTLGSENVLANWLKRQKSLRLRFLDSQVKEDRAAAMCRQLPRDFPKWQSVDTIFWRWRQAGFWQRIHDALRRQVRRAAGKDPEPSTGIMDSQLTDTAEGGEERGYDAAKQITGRRRPIVVDTLGLIIAVVVHGVSWQDYERACDLLMKPEKVGPRIQRVFADSAYGRNGLPEWVYVTFG